MDILYSLNILPLSLLMIVAYGTAAAQMIHCVGIANHKNIPHLVPCTVYEACITIHTLLTCMVLYNIVQGSPLVSVGFNITYINISALLWFNACIAVYGFLIIVRFKKPQIILDVFFLSLSIPTYIAIAEPWASLCFIGNMTYFLFRVSAGLVFDVRYFKHSISNLAILDALHKLPIGVMYADEQGRVIVMNDPMRHALHELDLGSDLVDARTLLQPLERMSRAFTHNEPQYMQSYSWDNGFPVPVHDDEMWLFMKEDVMLGDTLCMRLICADVSEEFIIQQKIEAMTREQRCVHEQLLDALDRVQEISQRDAVITMRSRVHDIVGQRLSILHRSLEDGFVTDQQLAYMKPILRNIIKDLTHSKDQDYYAQFCAIFDAYKLVDVSMTIDGEFPQNPTWARMTVQIVREATTNAIKHAQAHSIHVTFTTNNQGFILAVSNDGIPPAASYTEGNGLRGMRHSLDSIGGTLSVVTFPCFELKAYIPLNS